MLFQYLVFIPTLLVVWTVNAAFPSPRERDGIDRLVKRLLKDWHTPGMAIAIIDGENTWMKVRPSPSNLNNFDTCKTRDFYVSHSK